MNFNRILLTIEMIYNEVAHEEKYALWGHRRQFCESTGSYDKTISWDDIYYE